MVFLSVPVFAANETGGQTDLTFTYDPSSPTYTVTIPGSLALNIGDNLLPIEVSATANLGGKDVEVTFEGTQDDFIDFFTSYSFPALENDSDFIFYNLYNADNTEVSSAWGSSIRVEHGVILATFSDNGTKSIKLALQNTLYDGEPIPTGETFTGYIVFGIALV